MTKKNEEQTRAKESPQVRRARKKLSAQLEKEQNLINSDTLAKVSEGIKRWIERQAPDRVKLVDKKIELFDENTHAAKVMSQYVKDLRNQLKTDSQPVARKIEEGEAKPINEELSLKGRIHQTESRVVKDSKADSESE